MLPLQAEYCNADLTSWKLTLQDINTTPKELKTERDCSHIHIHWVRHGSSATFEIRRGATRVSLMNFLNEFKRFNKVTCSQTLYFLFKVRRARVIKYKPQGIYWPQVQGGSGGGRRK